MKVVIEHCLVSRPFAVLKALVGNSLNTAKFLTFPEYYSNLRSQFFLKIKKTLQVNIGC
jgi:hypothetical protein